MFWVNHQWLVNFFQHRGGIEKLNNRYYCHSFRSNIDFSTGNFLIFLEPFVFLFHSHIKLDNIKHTITFKMKSHLFFLFIQIFSLIILSTPSPLKWFLKVKIICKNYLQSTPSFLTRICKFIFYVWFFMQKNNFKCWIWN